MTPWQRFVTVARGGQADRVPVALIVDGPWLPGYAGIDTLDYFLRPDEWRRINLGLLERFPDYETLRSLRLCGEKLDFYSSLLEPDEAQPPHVHHDPEQICYVLQGKGTLLIGDDNPLHFLVKPSDLVRIPPHTFHRVHCESQEPVVYLCVDCFVGGRPQNEPTWESHVRVICAQNGWDFDQVRGKP